MFTARIFLYSLLRTAILRACEQDFQLELQPRLIYDLFFVFHHTGGRCGRRPQIPDP